MVGCIDVKCCHRNPHRCRWLVCCVMSIILDRCQAVWVGGLMAENKGELVWRMSWKNLMCRVMCVYFHYIDVKKIILFKLKGCNE